jgi:diaminohydroxyphosphoribosylaminopyrimidine deaminase/5-amino-6-(5-phosphoribosylamino)uracil reductase
MTGLPTPDARLPTLDERMMRLALRVARGALGQTAPNPAVGAVIADEATGEVVARGQTQISGRPHAEAHALGLAGGRARGKTMYVTLEPCSYHGRPNPQVPKAMPCAEAVLAAGMRRVVVATEDPNPEIAGRGVEVLRREGVAVDIGVCRAEARWSMAGHILRMTEGRPFVQLKVAVGGDGLIAPGDGAPVWVTGPDVRAYAHLLRARADAVSRSPRRVVLDTGFRISPGRHFKMFETARRVPVLIFGADGARPPAYPAGVEARYAPVAPDGRLSLLAVLGALAQDGVTRVLVEGGPTISAALLAADLVDEVVIAQGTEPVGAGGRRPFGARGLEALDDAARWQLAERRTLGADTLTIRRRAGRL